MANITRSNPWRTMRELLQWDPFGEMTPYTGGTATEEVEGFHPKFEVKETKDGYVFKADLPGVKDEDVDITLSGNRLIVSGKRVNEERNENERFYAYEVSYGSFSRSFTLPEGIDGDNMHAELKNGELKLLVPKKPESQPKKISLKPGGTSQKKALKS
jgi:HSP20 family protein